VSRIDELHRVTRPRARAADDFPAIGARMEELHRERSGPGNEVSRAIISENNSKGGTPSGFKTLI